MKTEIKVFFSIVPFLVVVTPIYGYFTDFNEWVGLTGLTLTAAFCLFISGYLWVAARKLDARPDDDPEGEISDIAGDYGHFAPYSWWPLYLAFFCALVFAGPALGAWWMAIIAVPFLAWAVVGWTFEFFRGEDAV